MLSSLLASDQATDAFRAGLFRWERRGRVPVPVRVWFGPPCDPETGAPLDRSWRWQFEFGGLELDLFAEKVERTSEEVLEAFWPKCRDSEIDDGEYRFLLDTARHARAHDPDSPFAHRHGRVDLLNNTIPDIGG